MANFVAIVDPVPARRHAFLRAVRERIAPLPALRTGQVALGVFAVEWAAGANAPVDSFQDATTAAVVWGDAIIGDDAAELRRRAVQHRLDARGVATAWGGASGGIPQAFDGFYAALHYDIEGGLTVGGDVCGLFPLYYAVGDGVTIAASSPELIGRHSLFPASLDPEGLVGMLLSHGHLGGRTLHRRVSRLSPGCTLRSTATGIAEVPAFRITATASAMPSSFGDQVERLHAAWETAMARHAPTDVSMGVLLSGGRDSRMLCGYLGERARGMPALTLGRRSDYEVRCARQVARALGLRHEVAALAEPEQPANALLQARWEHLGTGFSNVHMWSALKPLGQLAPRFLTGYLREALDFVAPSPDFEALFASPYSRGFSAAQLRRLLDPSWHPVIDERLAVMRDAYERSSEHAVERPWRFQLVHYARTHPGGVPWRLSFASWPVLPILDRALLNTIASVPLASLANRRAQDAILREYFPSLARLSLDRNHHDTEPLLSGTLRHRINPLLVAARERRAWLHRRLGRERSAAERRYYYRVYDIDGPGWRAVRHLAEPFRERLAPHFDLTEVSRWLPAPSQALHLADPIQDGFRPKTLLGLMLWAADHAS